MFSDFCRTVVKLTEGQGQNSFLVWNLSLFTRVACRNVDVLLVMKVYVCRGEIQVFVEGGLQSQQRAF